VARGFGPALLFVLLTLRVLNTAAGQMTAHGQMFAGQCYSADVIYACRLLYKVCCIPLMEEWDEGVRPALTVEEPGR
jgi:hypothetical protein